MRHHLTLNLRTIFVAFALLLTAAGFAARYAVSLASESDGRATEVSGEPRIAEAISPIDADAPNIQVNAAVATTRLVRGWNNVAFLGQDGAPATALAEISGKYDAVYRWDPTAKQYRLYGPGLPAFMNTLTTIGFGDGIWIFLTVETAQLTAVVGDGGANYTAGPGLQLTGVQFSVQFLATNAVNGTASSAARSDHTHFGEAWTGNTSGGWGLRVENAGAFGYGVMGKTGDATGILGYGSIAVGGLLSSSGCGPGPGSLSTLSAAVFGSTCIQNSASDGVRGYSAAGAGLHGSGPVTGVLGESIVSGADGIGVVGYAGAAAPVRPVNTGVYGYASGDNATGVYGRADGLAAVAVKGIAPTANEFAGLFAGKVQVNGALLAPSDARLKHAITPLFEGLDAVQALKPVSYIMNDDTSGATRYGLLAQDVLDVLPALVSSGGEDGMLALNYLELIPVLVKGIQEQQARIESLEHGGQGNRSQSTANAGAAQSSLNDWALPGAIALFGLGLFALAGVQLRRKA